MTETLFTFYLPILGNVTLSASSVISLLGIVVSLLASLIAIVISVKSLRQNSKMIEESSRPQIQIYPVYSNSILYLIIKNFGSSAAYIDEVKCSHYFSEAEIPGDRISGDIFSPLKGAVLSSGYAIRCPLLGYNVPDETFEFSIKYHSETKKYKSKFTFNPISNTIFADMYPSSSTTEGHLKNISRDLHDIVKMNL